MHEIAVGGSVRRGHVHVRFGHRRSVGDSWEHHGNARSQHDAELLPCHQATGLVSLPVLFKIFLIAHGSSSSPGLSWVAEDNCFFDNEPLATYYIEALPDLVTALAVNRANIYVIVWRRPWPRRLRSRLRRGIAPTARGFRLRSA